MDNPSKELPKVLILTLIIVTALYASVQGVAIGILGHNLAGQSVPIVTAFEQIIGPIGKIIIVIGMALSVLGVVISNIFNTPIEAASLANEKNLLPKILGKSNKYNSPWVANLLTMGIAILLVLSGGYLFLVGLIVFAAFTQYIATIFSVVKVRNDKNLQGEKLKGGWLETILATAVTIFIMFSFTKKTVLIGLIIFIVGCPIYFYQHGKNGKSKRKA